MKQIITVAFIALVNLTYAQQVSISGQMVDGTDSVQVPYQLTVNGTTYGPYTYKGLANGFEVWKQAVKNQILAQNQPANNGNTALQGKIDTLVAMNTTLWQKLQQMENDKQSKKENRVISNDYSNMSFTKSVSSTNETGGNTTKVSHFGLFELGDNLFKTYVEGRYVMNDLISMYGCQPTYGYSNQGQQLCYFGNNAYINNGGYYTQYNQQSLYQQPGLFGTILPNILPAAQNQPFITANNTLSGNLVYYGGVWGRWINGRFCPGG